MKSPPQPYIFYTPTLPALCLTFPDFHFFFRSDRSGTDIGTLQGRIQEFILGGAKPRSPIESWGRSPNRGREAPEYRGRSPSRGREAPENWGRSPNRGRSPRKSGGRGLGRGLGEPLPRKFLKIKLETIHFGAYLRQTFQINNNMCVLRFSVPFLFF